MKYSEALNLAVAGWRFNLDNKMPQQTLTLLGQPGIGKSALGEDIANAMTTVWRDMFGDDEPEAVCEVVDLSSRMPEDIGGLPHRHVRDGDSLTVYAIQKWLYKLCQPGVYGVLILDDLPAAANAVQVAVRQLALYRRIGDWELSPGVLVLVTGNRREDKSAATTLPAHFRNSTQMLTIEPDVEQWSHWYGKQAHHAPIVGAFLRYRPSFFSQLPRDADGGGSFATPRTWAMLGRTFEVAQEQELLLDVARGLVGEGPAMEFQAFVNVRSQLVDPRAVFDNPETSLPDVSILNSPDKLVAMATALGEIGALRGDSANKKERSEMPLKLLRAIAWVTQEGKEYCAQAVSTFVMNGGNIDRVFAEAEKHLSDPLIKGMLLFLHESFNPSR